MNKKIKAMRFAAADHANKLKPLGITAWNEIRDAKFAELIVSACADAADHARQADCPYAGDYVVESMGYEQSVRMIGTNNDSSN